MGRKEQKELLITAVMAIVFVAVAANTFSKVKAKKVILPPAPAPSVDIAVTQPAKKFADTEKKDQEWGRDPFILGKVTAQEEIGIVLGGIIWDEKEPYAIINDEVVRKGDRIGGIYTVVDIKEDRVILNNGKEQFALNVWE